MPSLISLAGEIRIILPFPLTVVKFSTLFYSVLRNVLVWLIVRFVLFPFSLFRKVKLWVVSSTFALFNLVVKFFPFLIFHFKTICFHLSEALTGFMGILIPGSRLYLALLHFGFPLSLNHFCNFLLQLPFPGPE